MLKVSLNPDQSINSVLQTHSVFHLLARLVQHCLLLIDFIAISFRRCMNSRSLSMNNF